ncbi:dihydroxyacetone kinase subunit DhaL [Halanaerobium kushneri]|uniref:phosphoenolpyruvate--glycerone phosphotransferase n=1 Tax=Halanaerobium kushneri TaxID=56779 RepID=A0A1N6S186_9FIRM|nr:dihydroxyacetone kinase subunit DhaL [Halanaerobium kushneri]SIQ34809.1 dihydroxyacetone kinase, C-terminal domain [Halanaerobium kushneri]
MVELKIEDLKEIFVELEKTAKEKKDILIELDSAMGDGDLGITMEKAFSAAREEAENYAGDNIGELLKKAGFAMANKAAATMGTLTATAFIRAAAAADGNNRVDYDKIVLMFEKGIEGIKERGKAEVGDKTMLDSLVPAYNALKESRDNGADLKEGMKKAVQAAENGVEQTKNMVSQFGRAHYYGEKSKGKKDPGAAAAFFFLESFSRYLN